MPPLNANAWIEFWDRQEVFRELAFDKCMELFVDATDPIIGYRADDVVLDIGCGPGALPQILRSRVREIHCADVSERYLAHCRARFAGSPNVLFHKLDPGNYTDLTPAAGRRYTLMLALSVAQYYGDVDDLERLILAARALAAPGARMMISDLPHTSRLAVDVITHFIEGYRRRYLGEIVRMLFRARFSDYPRLRRQAGVLTFTDDILGALAARLGRLGVGIEILDRRLTVNGGRRHLLVRFMR